MIRSTTGAQAKARSRRSGSPLFQGQTTHPLTQRELEIVLSKLNISATPEHKQMMIAAIRTVAETPTGRVQLREIMNSPIQTFDIICNEEGDAECLRISAGGFYNENQGIVISSHILEGKKRLEQTGHVLLHELLHNRQSVPMGNSLLADMETQALSWQLSHEMGVGTPSYQKSYETVVEKWRRIVEGKDPQNFPRPDWAPPFEPMPGLSATQLRQAREEYVQQMAAQEVQALAMQDFVMSRGETMRGEFSMAVPDYDALARGIVYSSNAVRDNKTNFNMTPDQLEYLKRQYPALDMGKVQESMNELGSEYAATKREQLKSKSTWSLIGNFFTFPFRFLKTWGMGVWTAVSNLFSSEERAAEKTAAYEAVVKDFEDNSPAESVRGIMVKGTDWLNNLFVSNQEANWREKYAEFSMHTEVLAEVKDKKMWDKICAVEGENQGDLLQKRFDCVMDSDISLAGKIFLLSHLFADHQKLYPDLNSPEGAVRAELIQALRERSGVDGLPLVQNRNGRLLNQFREYGRVVPQSGSEGAAHLLDTPVHTV